MNPLDRQAIVAQLVTEHPAAARVLQKYGIDYCCHGDVTVLAACHRAHLDPDAIAAELAGALAERREDDDPRALGTAALVARIVERHHGYLRRALPHVAPIAAKIAYVHGPRHADASTLDATFRELADGLLPHLDDEEKVLFPALLAAEPDAAVVGRELERMHADHRAVGAQLARIRTLTGGFATPEWGCTTYRVLMRELEALEADVLRHVHLENHVLAPRFGAPAPPWRDGVTAAARRPVRPATS